MKRDAYERELCQLVEKHSTFLGQRGAHTDGVDVLLYRAQSPLDCQLVRCEVKTSKKPVVYVSGSARLKEQYDAYVALWEEHGVMTWYAFRIITKKDRVCGIEIPTPESKWRFFRLDALPESRNGTPVVKFDYPGGLTFDQWLALFK